MQMVRHNKFGMGEVVRREVINDFTYLWVRYDNGMEMKLAMPFSFTVGAVEPLGELKDEVDQMIVEKMARLAVSVPVKTTVAAAKKVSAKHIPSSPIEAAFEKYLIARGYKVEGERGNRSTVYYYLDGVADVLTEEGISWDTLKMTASQLVPEYEAGGAKELIGARQHRTVINGLKHFVEFANQP